MRLILSILALFLYCFLGGSGVVGVCLERVHDDISEVCQDNGRSECDFGANDLAMLPAGTSAYSGMGGGSAPSVNPAKAARRFQNISKSTADSCSLIAFGAGIVEFQACIHSSRRYIHSICHLLI